VAIVFDNQVYGRMGSTASSRVADLEKIAQGAGIRATGTLRTLGDFTGSVRKALEGHGLSFFVAKVEPGGERLESDYIRADGRPVKEAFVEALLRYPDYRSRRVAPW